MKIRPRNLTLLALALAFTAGPVRGQERPLHKNTHTIMHFTPDWVKAHHERRAKLPVIRAPRPFEQPQSPRRPGDTLGVNLSTNMNFASCGGPVGWDQGQCGNCWVFGSTAAASVDDGVASGVPQLFSTQWFDSDYYATEQDQSTCNGGDDTTFASWYNSYPKFIPWTNTGAGYADGNGPGSPATPVSAIAQNPYVGVGQISVAQIATSSVTQAEAIANIKSVLDSNQAVTLAFFLPEDGWTDFDNAWDSQSETTPWAGVDTYSGGSMAGGHLVCVVGYDDTDNAWIIQNSWGTTSGRPDGWFELSQDMNYADTISDGDSFDMWEFDAFVPTGWSNESTGAPTITTQPASQTVTAGATATFSVVAAGTGPLSYQWSQGSTAISGATSASYTTPPTTAAYNGTTYHVVVSNAGGSVTSANATLTVTSAVTAPAITRQPASQTVNPGATATFSVAATGTAPLGYQWFQGGTAISGATAASYTTPPATTAASGTTYHVVVSNAAGSVTSANATLTVTSAVTAPAITRQPASQTVNPGATATFSVAATGSAPLGYQWFQGSAAIGGATAASYTTPPATAAASGTTYHVVVSNAAGSVTSANATLTVTSSVVTELIVNGGFELGATGWNASAGVIGQWGSAAPAYMGTWDAWLCGTGAAAGSTSTLSQTVTIPATATYAALGFQLHIDGTASGRAGNTFKASVLTPSGSLLAALASYTNAQAASGYQAHSFDLMAYKGQTVTIAFTGTPAPTSHRRRSETSFVLDNVSLETR